MTRYQVDSDEVAATAGRARAAIAGMQADVGRLHGELTQLQGSWTGQASAAFQVAVGEWAVVQRRVEEALTGLNAALASAGRAYDDAEAHNARLFTR